MPQPCRNCGEDVAASYCSHCGQRRVDRRRTVRALLGEAFSELFALDGRHLRTMRGLLEPGRLTVDYLAGRRARYVTPVRTYLAMSLLFFLTVSLPVPDASVSDVFVNGEIVGEREPSDERRNFQFSTVEQTSALGIMLEQWLGSPSERWKDMSAQELLDGFFAGMESSLPKALILFVPFLALALKVLYIRTGRLYYDHLIFALHFQSFLFLALIGIRVLNSVVLQWLAPAAWAYLTLFGLVAPAYLFLALRKVYAQGRVLSLVKIALLLALYLVLTIVVLAVTMMMAFYMM